MRRVVFGLGAAQVLASALAVRGGRDGASGLDWRPGSSWAASLAMSSTAILAKMLTERLELNSPHGRQIIGILLFQDLAVVPLLILFPRFAAARRRRGARPSGWRWCKAGVVLVLILYCRPDA